MSDITQAVIPAQTYKKKLGLICAKIGTSFAHKLGIDFPLEPPEYSTLTKTVGGAVRTRVSKQPPHYEYAKSGVDGGLYPTKAKAGATVYLEVQDITRLEPELVEHIHWVCTHENCRGKRWPSKAELVQAHPKNKDLIAEAELHTVYGGLRHPGGAHVYYGVIEIAGVPERKNDKGVVVAPAQLPVVMLCSDEE